MRIGPLSGASMGIVASTEDCALISTITTSALPTAIDVVTGSGFTASPTSSLIKRALPEPLPPYGNYVGALGPPWLGHAGNAAAQWYSYPEARSRAIAGVKGLYGCTCIIIPSAKGVYVSHIFENPVFIMNQDYHPTDDNTFTINTFIALRDGTPTAQSITDLVGTDQFPGVLHARYKPQVFVVTPLTSDFDRFKYGITTQFRYQNRAEQLAQQIAQIVPGSGPGVIQGYTRTNDLISTAPGFLGRAVLEADPVHHRVVLAQGPRFVDVGQWRLWVDDKWIDQVYVDPDLFPPPPLGRIKGRSVVYKEPCMSSSITTSFVLNCMPV